MNNFVTRLITGFLAVISISIIYCYLPVIALSLLFTAILLIILIVEWKHLFSPKQAAFWLLMPFYPIAPFAALIFLNQHSLYHKLLLPLMIMVASHDTGSYCMGKLLGAHKIAPYISPGKSWEGFWGGCLCALIALFLLSRIYNYPGPLGILCAITLATCIISLAGDLFESWLKRRARCKDSGFLLPGHGGLLDRCDGLMFAALFFFILKNYLITVF